jgi:hypothetical protein
MNLNKGGASIKIALRFRPRCGTRKVNSAIMQERKVISIDTKKCCYCGKTLQNKSDQFALNETQVVCSACWDAAKASPFGKTIVHFPTKN